MPIENDTFLNVVIYDHPIDYPADYVVRVWRIESGNPNPIPEAAYTFPTLLDAREFIRQTWPEAVCITRAMQDDPVIVECWI